MPSPKFHDITGLKINKLLALKFIKKDKNEIYWEFQCDCGNRKIISVRSVKRELTKSCGCFKKEGKYNDLIGKTFCYLKVKSKSNIKLNRYVCVCKCNKEIEVKGSSLVNSNTKSCGCLKIKSTSQRFKKPPQVANLNRIFSFYKRNAKRRNFSWELTKESVLDFIKKPCFYCNKKWSCIYTRKEWPEDSVYYNGIDRIDSNKGYSLDNCVTCCKFCNMSKSNRTKEDFYNWIKDVYNNIKDVLQ